MTDEQAETIVANTDRIATALETLLSNSQTATEVDIGAAVQATMDAVAKANPVFGAALKEMQNRIEAGDPS